MHRTDLAKAVAEQIGMPQSEVEVVIETMCQTIALGLSCGESVKMRGFGTFEAKEQSPLHRVVPGVGDVTSETKKKVVFHASRDLRDRVNGERR